MPKKDRTDELESLTQAEKFDLENHLRVLGVATVQAYREWCRDNGFGPQLRKRPHQRRAEEELVVSRSVEAAFRRSKRERRNPEELVDEILAGRVEPGDLSPEFRVVHQLVPTLGRHEESRRRFRALIAHALKVSKVFDTRPVIDDYPRNEHNTMVGALASLATHHGAWVRPLEDWRPRTKNKNRQFASLARHLLAEYPVPGFMESVWFKRSRTQNWFIHVGRGHNIRTAERLFIPLTKRMAHELMQAPDHYTIEHAFRWGQVHALGGNPRVADGVRTTRIAASFANDDFWSTVVRFFVRNPMLDTAMYGPMADYIHHQKYESIEVFVRPGVVETQPPPHPGFSMRGRSADVLLRQVDGWHRNLGRAWRQGDRAWQSSGIQPLELFEGVEGSKGRRRWTIYELLSSNALIAEGRAMHHCVASYAGSCAAGRSSVWSMQCSSHEGESRVLTIEVQPSDRRVVEARGKYNEPPAPKAMSILQRWAEREDLLVPSYIAWDR